jgi:hypothetical protein
MSEYINLTKRLEADLEEVGALLLMNQGNSALECAYIRTMFSTLEGILYAFRLEVIESNEFEQLFDLPSQAKLLEKKFDANKQCITSDGKFLSFKQAVKTSSRSLAKVRGKNPDDFPFNCSGWDNVLDANKIRDRITHPKKVDDLIIGNDGLGIIVKAKVWLKNELFSKLIV